MGRPGDYLVEHGIPLPMGPRRLKVARFLMQHDELDDPAWFGHVEFHFGGNEVKAALVPAPTSIKLPELASS